MHHPAPLEAWIDGIGLLAPGLANWAQARAVLRGEQVYQAAPTELPPALALPAAERRRASGAVRLTLGAGLEAAQAAGLDAAQCATVFSSSGGDNPNCHAICETLAGSDPLLSPTRFHNSVHNAASGYWGIATGCMQPSAVLCAHDASFAAGLLEALTQVALLAQPVLLLVYDTAYPQPLRGVRPTPDALCIALALAPVPGERSLAGLQLDPRAPWGAKAPDTLPDPALESLRGAIAAARGLPLLQAVSLGRDADLALEYTPGQALRVRVRPC